MRILHLGLAAALFGGECFEVRLPEFGRLEVVATSLVGERLSNASVTFFQGDRKVDVDLRRVPYGDYRIQIFSPGFKSAWRDIGIYQAETTIQQELQVSLMACSSPRSQIGGTLVGLNDTKDVWVKAVPLRGVGGGESIAGRRGTFLISGLDDTPHILIVTRGDTVLHQQVIPRGNGRLGLAVRIAAL